MKKPHKLEYYKNFKWEKLRKPRKWHLNNKNHSFKTFLHSVLQGISANGDGDVSPAEKHADELMLDARLAVWELLEDPNARNVIREFFEDVKKIHEDETSAYMMVGVTQQIKDTLTNEHKGALSVKYIVDAIREWSIEPKYSDTIEEVYKATHRTIVDPNTPKWLNKIFDFLEASVKTHRGADVIRALSDGVCEIIEKPDTKENIVQAFINGKQLISTSMKKKITHFVVKG